MSHPAIPDYALTARRSQIFRSGYFLATAFSSTSCSTLAAALPDILKYREEGINWTGNWAEIVPAVSLGACALTYFVIYCYSANRTIPPRALIGVHVLVLHLLVECLVFASSVGDSDKWKATPDSGTFWDRWQAGSETYLQCNTLSRKGPNCDIETLKKVSSLQIVGITFLSGTLALNITMFVLTIVWNFEYLKRTKKEQIAKRRAERVARRQRRMKKKQNIESFDYVNEIPSDKAIEAFEYNDDIPDGKRWSNPLDSEAGNSFEYSCEIPDGLQWPDPIDVKPVAFVDKL